MVIETQLSIAEFFETWFEDITGIHIGVDQADKSILISRARLALTHISNCLRDWVLFSYPFSQISARIAQFQVV